MLDEQGDTQWREAVLEDASTTTPTLVVCVDQARRNIAAFGARARAHGVNVRPHFKGHKAVALLDEQLAAGAVGVEVAKISEIQLLAGAGVDTDVVLAWAWASPIVWDCAARLAAEGLRLTVDVDGPELIDGYEAAAARHGATLGVRVQVDAGLRGAPPETVADLARQVAAAPHLRLAALTCYRSTYLRSMQRDPRPFEVLGREEGELLARLAAGLHDDIGPLDLVCGSSATAWGAARVSGVTEVVTGNGAVRDWGLAHTGVIDATTIAAGVVATVLEVAGDQVVVDAGTEVLGQGQTYPGLDSLRAATADGGLSIDETEARIGRGTRRRGWSASAGDRVLLLPSSISLAVANPGSTTVVTGSGAIVGSWERVATDTPSMDVEIALAAAWAAR